MEYIKITISDQMSESVTCYLPQVECIKSSIVDWPICRLIKTIKRVVIETTGIIT